MLVSNCCGKQGYVEKFDERLSGTNYYNAEDEGVCPECGEHCEYIDEEDEETIELKAIYENYPNLDHVNPEYRKYYGQIKKDDND